MDAFFGVRIGKLRNEAARAALARADDALCGRGSLPEGWQMVAAKAPWQTLLWAIMRLLFVACFGFLSVLMWMTADVPRLDAVPGAPPVSDRGVQILAVVFFVWAVYLLWRAVVKFGEWRRYTKRFLLWTPDFLLERKEKMVTLMPWKLVRSVEILEPSDESNDPGVRLVVNKTAYVISCAQSVSPVAGSNRSMWYNVVPGAMAFSPEPAYYVEGAMAIKRRVEAYVRH